MSICRGVTVFMLVLLCIPVNDSLPGRIRIVRLGRANHRQGFDTQFRTRHGGLPQHRRRGIHFFQQSGIRRGLCFFGPQTLSHLIGQPDLFRHQILVARAVPVRSDSSQHFPHRPQGAFQPFGRSFRLPGDSFRPQADQGRFHPQVLQQPLPAPRIQKWFSGNRFRLDRPGTMVVAAGAELA